MFFFVAEKMMIAGSRVLIVERILLYLLLAFGRLTFQKDKSNSSHFSFQVDLTRGKKSVVSSSSR